ncbi:putative quinol monooxygenase [Pseudonocardia pini]|uniref:putative quinol monooxygenase n=1 Tax=Pseudonocardia pini TaxID=2758030 RepID=UPI0015F03D7F|nr:antibiotic biosynthesis monooxygenase family protein [Pseudonocardia pini]
MLTAILELTFRADELDSSMKQLDAILADTRAFDGCTGVEVLVDVTDPARVSVVERWESLEHDAAYRAWRATEAGASPLGSLLAAPPKLVRFETASTL